MKHHTPFLLTFLLAAGAVMAVPTVAGSPRHDIPAQRQKTTALTTEEQRALTFLYRYMAQADKADHDTAFHLDNVRWSLRARREMPWGRKVPEREWLHFVLPERVNNEDLDASRGVLYQALLPRVQHLSMADAALEVNHWCHEHVSYQPSDARTSSPLATLRTATGRCGEESTLTVAALRAVGIPARQVYTPRWAHTDDNHAWVEVWVDGQWCFLGACEPEPVLNLGWFNAPASRGMLMHTKVFGHYDGPEEVMKRTPLYTEINVTDHYAETSRLDVRVVDTLGRPVPGARVEYKLYNYAEFYSVATKTSDRQGRSFLTAGRGDMLVWASKNGRFGFSKATFGKDSLVTVALSLDGRHLPVHALDIDIVPPAEHAVIPPVSDEQRQENNRRVAHEDSLRQAYTHTFMTEASAREFARKHHYNADDVAPLLVASRGNHETICHFLSKRKSKEREDAVELLKSLSQKDLRDVTEAVLRDHLMAYQPEWESTYGINRNTFDAYVRCPRISNELLTPFRSFLGRMFTHEIMGKKAIKSGRTRRYVLNQFRGNPHLLVEFVDHYVMVDDSCNLGAAPISPIGVWKGRKADPHSRDIFFVALARTIGLPARIDPVTGKVQIMKGGQPQDIVFGTETPAQQGQQGVVQASYEPAGNLSNPKYYNHFTLSRITEEGRLQLLNYDEGDGSADSGANWANLLKNGTTAEAGPYLLVSGTRLSDGSVLGRLQFLTVPEGDTVRVPLVMRQSASSVQVIGTFNSESTYLDPLSEKSRSVLSATGRGNFALAVIGAGQEPTEHALRDIAALKPQFEAWGGRLLVLFTSKEEWAKHHKDAEMQQMPATTVIGIDADGSILRQIKREMHLTAPTLPVVILADTFNRVFFARQGYTIGLGQQLLDVVHKL